MNTALASGLQGHLSTVQHALPRRARAQVAVRCSSSCDGDQPQQQSSRRGMLQLAAAAAVLPFLGGAGPAAAAEAEGLNPFRAILRAPADFYRSTQQQNGGAKILAPIRASRQRLEECAAALDGVGVVEGGFGSQAYVKALSELRAASLNCYVYETLGSEGLEERASLLQQQLPLSDPCTFRILHKNALTLVTDPALEVEITASLNALLRGMQLLDDKLDLARQGDAEAAQEVPVLLQACIDNNVRFENAVKACIGVA